MISIYVKLRYDRVNIAEELDHFSNQEIFEEFKMFFLAGTDTTAHFTQMMVYYLIKNPQA